MDIERAKILLESLLGRMERDANDGHWRLVGPISPHERSALHFVLTHLGVELEKDENDERPSAPTVLPKVSLDTRAAKMQAADSPEIVMCIDFGTAMSKAFAFNAADGDATPIELGLGRRAGYTESVYPVPSSVFISNGGKVFLGHEAISNSVEEAAEGRERFDSPKQELSQGNADLASVMASQSINPTGVPLTKEDLITLYLAYITDLAGTELAERHKQSRYVRRRFARPCWDGDRVKWAESQLKRMLARAQILADTFTGQWKGGIDVRKVRAAFDALNDVELPSCLVGEGIPEPIAAASSLVISDEPQRRGFIVVDVGAGTTDFGVFVATQLEDRPAAVFQVPGTIHGLRQAGDTVDSLLRGAILQAHNVDLGGPIGQRISKRLNMDVRSFKERLFRDGVLRYRLADDSDGEIALDQFLNLGGVQRFHDSLQKEFERVIERIPQSYLEGMFAKQGIEVVLTGGGAALPMVQELAKGSVRSRGVTLHRTEARKVPAWIQDGYRDFAPEYSQLAVAIGGASPSLPKLGPEFLNFGGGLAKPTYEPGNLLTKGV
jgi:molecular chaperone HscA